MESIKGFYLNYYINFLISDIEGGNIIIKPKKPKNKENKEFKCNFPSCCKEFTKKSKLSRHFLTHNKNREKFFCNSENCKKSYFTKYDLVVHQVKYILY